MVVGCLKISQESADSIIIKSLLIDPQVKSCKNLTCYLLRIGFPMWLGNQFVYVPYPVNVSLWLHNFMNGNICV